MTCDVSDSKPAPKLDEFEARELAGILRRSIRAEAVIKRFEDGDFGGEQLGVMMSEALAQAEAGILSASTIAGLSRFAKGRPRVANWLYILHRILEAQEPAEARLVGPRGSWTYAVNPRRWTQQERDDWARHHKGVSLTWLEAKWDLCMGDVEAGR